MPVEFCMPVQLLPKATTYDVLIPSIVQVGYQI